MKRSNAAWVVGAFIAVCMAASNFAPREARADGYIGRIYVHDGGSASNFSTTCRDAGIQGDGGTVVPDGGSTDLLYGGCGFGITAGSTLSVQCRQDCQVNADVTSCDAITCPRLFAGQWLTMPVLKKSTNQFTRFSGWVDYDGGLASANATYSGGVFAVSPADAGNSCDCMLLTQPDLRR